MRLAPGRGGKRADVPASWPSGHATSGRFGPWSVAAEVGTRVACSRASSIASEKADYRNQSPTPLPLPRLGSVASRGRATH